MKLGQEADLRHDSLNIQSLQFVSEFIDSGLMKASPANSIARLQIICEYEPVTIFAKTKERCIPDG